MRFVPGRHRTGSEAGAAGGLAAILGAASALSLLSILCRGRLTNVLIWVDLPTRLQSPVRLATQLVVGAYYDLLLIGAVTLPFVALVCAARNRPGVRRAAGAAYGAVALAVLFTQTINVSIVHYLGTPFTRQWLYYSDSLGSLEARNALLATLPRIAPVLAASALGLFLASRLFRAAYAAAFARWSPRLLAAGLSMPIVLFLPLGHWYLPTLQFNHSLVANPVFAFAGSFLKPDSPALFTMATPASAADFLGIAAAHHQNPRVRAVNALSREPVIKNVIVFVFESVAAQYLEPYGGAYPVTPELQKMRSKSVLFENIYAHAPNTNVSMVSLLTATYPWISTKFVTREYPAIALRSITEELRRTGFQTAFFNSADLRFNGAEDFLRDQGFDVLRDDRTIPCDRAVDIGGGAMIKHLVGPAAFDGVHDLCTAAALSRWVGEKDAQDRPFFAVMWTGMTHHPYLVGGEETDFGVHDDSFNRYLNALRDGDRTLGAIMRDLEARGLADSTLVVVLGDHGEAFGSHGQVVHASNVYEENVHIPLLLINSRLFGGERNATVGGIADIAPTIMELLAAPAPADWQGQSLFSPSRSQRTYFFTAWADLIAGYRERDRKFVYDDTTEQYAIYDLANDPHETRNLIDEQPQMKSEIINRLAAWVQYQNRMIKERTIRLAAPAGGAAGCGSDAATTGEGAADACPSLQAAAFTE